MTKQTRDGRMVEMVVSADGRQIAITLAGQTMRASAATLIPTGIASHPYAVGTIALTSAEADTLRAEVAAAKSAYAESAAGLRERRASLVLDLTCAVESVRARRNRQMESEDGCTRALPTYADATITAAEQALRDFDAAHPEVKAALDAETAERVARNVWM